MIPKQPIALQLKTPPTTISTTLASPKENFLLTPT
jgi:hypothetical protein